MTPFPPVVFHLWRITFKITLSKTEVLEDAGHMAILLVSGGLPLSPLSVKDPVAGAVPLRPVWSGVGSLVCLLLKPSFS